MIQSILFFGVLFLFRACLWGVIENLWRARSVGYRHVAARDFAAQIFTAFVAVPLAAYLSGHMMFAYHPFPETIQYLPILLRILFYYVIGDFCYYWAHRLMHTNILWPVHRWHHSPTHMYWLAGSRGTIQHVFLVTTSFALAAPILYPEPRWVFTALVIYAYLLNDWMHLNLRWRARWFEWFIVTPRYHHIHHSSNPDHYYMNLGNLFTFWDRLFGTYLDPDTLETKELQFGIGEKLNPVRLIAGF